MPISDRAANVHEAGGRGDRHQPADRADRGTDGAGLALVPPAHRQVGQPGHRGSGIGDHEGAGRQTPGGHRAAGIEAEPAEPEQRGAEHHVGGVVRLHLLLPRPMRGPSIFAATRAETPELMWTTLPPAKSRAPRSRSQPSQPPDPVGQRVVDEGRPEQAEDHVGLEALPLGEGPGDQGGRDHREHHLEDHEGLVRDGRGVAEGIGRRQR